MRGALLLLILLVPVAFALEDIDVWVGNDLLEYVTPGQEIDVTIGITPTQGATRVSIQSDAWPVGHPSTVQLDATNCYECFVDATIVGATSITFRAGDDTGASIEETLVFQVDGSGPRISEFMVGNCRSNCRVSESATPVTFRVTDDVGVFLDSVKLFANNREISVAQDENCAVCFSASLPGGLETDVRITAKDLAGNDATFEVTLEYDGQDPIFIPEQELRFVGISLNSGRYILAGGLPHVVAVGVQESSGATIEFESPVVSSSAPCTPGPDYLDCRVTVTPPNVVSGVTTATVTITDDAGNSASDELEFEVFEADDSTQNEFWSASARAIGRIDAATWHAHSKDYQLQLRLTPSVPGAEPVQVDVEQCSFGGRTDVVDGEIHVSPVENGRAVISLVLAARPTAELSGDDFFDQEISCEVNVITKIGNTIYPNAETETVSAVPRYTSRVPDPRSMLEQEKTQSALDQSNAEQNVRDHARTMFALQGLCGVPIGIQAGASATALAGQGLELAGLGTITRPAMNGLGRTSDRLQDTNNRFMRGFGKVCPYLACEKDIVDFSGLSLIPDNLAESLGDVSDAGDLYDPYKSLPVAIAQGCVPAVVYHEQLMLNNQCQYNACMTTLASTGNTVADCSGQRSYTQCRLITGWAFNAVPDLNIYGSMRDRVAAALADPVGVLTGVGFSAACKYGLLQTFACSAPQKVGQLVEVKNNFQQMGRQFTTTTRLITGDICAGAVDEINNYERPIQFEDRGQTWCNGGFCRFDSGARTFFSDGKTAWIATPDSDLANWDPNDVDAATSSLDSTQRAQLMAGAKLEKIVRCGDSICINGDTNRPIGGVDPEYLREVSRESRVAEFNGLSSIPGASEVITRMRTNVDALVEVRDEIAVLEPTVLGLEARLNELKSCQNNPGSSFCMTDDGQTEESIEATLDPLKEELDGLVEQEEDLEKDLNGAANELQTLAKREEYRHFYDAVRNTVNNMLVFSQTSEFIFSRIDRPGLWGDLDAKWDRIVAKSDLETAFINNACNILDKEPDQSVAFLGSAGTPAMRISAFADTREGDSGNDEYQYVVNVFILLEEPLDQPGRVIIRQGTHYESLTLPSGETTLDLTGRVSFTGDAAITTVDSDLFTEACIVLPVPISQVAELSFGSDGRELCTRIEVAS